MFKTQIIGHIGQDAVAKVVTGYDKQAVSFTVAHTERYKNAQGTATEKTTWIECTMWREKDRLAVVPYLLKGQLVYCEGKVEAASYLDKETGELRQKLRLNLQDVQLLGASVANKQPQGQSHARPQQPQQQQQPQAVWNPQTQRMEMPVPSTLGQQPLQDGAPYGYVDQAALQRMQKMNTSAQPTYVPPQQEVMEDDLPF
jgi:single-strand DNA-binding protein